MRTMPCRLLLIALASVVLNTGCLYRMAVQQGNVLDDTQVEELKTGMTRSQVLYLLGTPMLPHPFDNDRWDYYHYLDRGRGEGLKTKQSRRITVWFKDDVVERIEDSEAKGAPAPGATPPG